MLGWLVRAVGHYFLTDLVTEEGTLKGNKRGKRVRGE